MGGSLDKSLYFLDLSDLFCKVKGVKQTQANICFVIAIYLCYRI